MLKKIAFGLGLVLAGFLAVTAAQPDEYRVVRTATINAAPTSVFALINDFHNWDKWSPSPGASGSGAWAAWFLGAYGSWAMGVSSQGAG